MSVTVADSVIRTRNARTNFLVMEFYCHTQQWSANGRITAESNLELLDASHCRSVVAGVAFLVVIVLRVSWEAGGVEHAASGGVQLNSYCYYRHQATVVSVRPYVYIREENISAVVNVSLGVTNILAGVTVYPEFAPRMVTVGSVDERWSGCRISDKPGFES